MRFASIWQSLKAKAKVFAFFRRKRAEAAAAGVATGAVAAATLARRAVQCLRNFLIGSKFQSNNDLKTPDNFLAAVLGCLLPLLVLLLLLMLLFLLLLLLLPTYFDRHKIGGRPC